MVVALEVYVLRRLTRSGATAQDTKDLYEQALACLSIIVFAGALIAVTTDPGQHPMFIVVPAVPGVLHDLLAKPPIRARLYSGAVSGRRLKAVRMLPLAVLVFALSVFLSADPRSGMRRVIS